MASPKAHLLEPSMRPYALSIGLSVMTLLAVGCKSGDLEDSGGSGVGEDSRFTVTDSTRMPAPKSREVAPNSKALVSASTVTAID